MAFREIETTRFAAAPLRDQPAPSLAWVSLAELIIDDRYQRSLTTAGRRHIQRIADGWDWKKYQPILVAPTADGRLAVVDGQHRAHAAAVVGLEKIPAMTVAMTPQEQAEGFAAVNRDRIRLDAPSIYRAELAAQADWAMRAFAAVDAAGCTLLTYNPSSLTRKPGQVTAHGLIRKMVEAGEDIAVTTGLAAIRRSVSGGTDRAYEGAILKIWLPLLATNQTFLRLPLQKIFDEIDWEGEADLAKQRARVTGTAASEHLRQRVLQTLRDGRAAS